MDSQTEQIKGLEAVMKLLNSPAGETLRDLVTCWRASGPNVGKFVRDYPHLWAECLKEWKPILMPTRTGACLINLTANLGADGVAESLGPVGIRRKCFVVFDSLLINTEWRRLRGPCAKCGNWFVARRNGQRVYCSGRCARYATATETTGRKRAEAKKEKLERVRSALREWRKQTEESDWKRFVAGATGIDLRFITRAVGNDEIQEPRGR